LVHTFQDSNCESEKIKRCQRILDYWLDSELFDLPECPMGDNKQFVSQPADEFEEFCVKAEQKYKEGKFKISEDSRLVIMFQCHRAGYITSNDEKHPNYNIPRTYLVAQAMLPCWDEERNTIVWLRSEEEQDLIVNLATMRTLYRRCRSSVPSNMSLPDWVEARIESIEGVLYTGLCPDNEDSPLTTEQLRGRIIKINRELAEQFWPDEEAREYMRKQCQPIESRFQDDKLDAPYRLSNGGITFRWRFCYYPEGSESQQLGPFFVRDLERTITLVEKSGIEGLSKPLQSYLLGKDDQIEIGKAVNQGNFFWPLTNTLIRGRWPENPEYGLSLLQTVAVNVVSKLDENPIVAVNGPPGTGKTTLLRDVIADKFVARTRQLQVLSSDDDWITKPEVVEVIMQHSIVVASSNNKAVENISKELPSFAKLPSDFASFISHFKELAPNSDWGLFCAVLGNSANRNAFKPSLKRLCDHMHNVNDYFQLNYLVNLLQKKGKNEASQVFLRFTTLWKNSGKLIFLVEDIKQCKAFKDHKQFFEPFTSALTKIAQNKLTPEKFSDRWKELGEEEWEFSIDAIDKFKRQWFGKKLYQVYLNNKLKEAEKSFKISYAKIQELVGSNANFDDWQLDTYDHLASRNAYMQRDSESEEEAERRLQLSSPWGSTALNRHRSELFIKALALNEAMLENAASQLAKYWEQLEQLIDGRLETKENNPEHLQLWALLFLFFPVVSTSLSSVENQFKLMQKTSGFGLVMIDEAGQAVNYHVVGLLQRCRQAIFVGDPIQLEPVVTIPSSIDFSIADDFSLKISKQEGENYWGDDYLVSASSAQSIADHASQYMAKIGERKVGIPLLVHRRCSEPMFSVANKIAYDNRMVLASQPFEWPAIPSGWIHVCENLKNIKIPGYANSTEAATALELLQWLVEEQQQMVEGGVYIITPFSAMRQELKKHWKEKAKSSSNHEWMRRAFGKQGLDVNQFAEDNIGTVHTFQGKEASTVIFCTSASKVRNKVGGIVWVNSKPNLINVAVTRAKHHLFIIGNRDDWSFGTKSCELLIGGMSCYENIEEFKLQAALTLDEQYLDNKVKRATAKDVTTQSVK
jgi:AAA domain